MAANYVMRPSRLDDFDALLQLAQLSGPGFTSLPVDEGILKERLEKSERAFSGRQKRIDYGKYLLMMEHLDTGEVVGCSAVKAGTGIDQPFFNYRVITLAQASHAAGNMRFDMDALILTNEYVGYTEVGTLFLKPEHRGGGAGRLAAQSRYLLMAAAPDRFSDHVLAELRGVVDDKGRSEFWECLGRHFFRMDFTEADRLSATTDNQFIVDLMPKYPIYVDLLPPEAREVIGRCHSDGVGAYKLLQWEGFQFDRTVDIFDGGPLVAAQRRHIRTIQESRVVTLEPGRVAGDPATRQGLAATNSLPDFRASLAEVLMSEDGNVATIDPATIEALQLKRGAEARVWLRS
ncbi:arginine N-succinyltransferase [Hyphomonas johnsonii]|jgi:arginine N-succinyltransferase|uniref:Arginine/ornithine succinyltransferase subunit n=1 Tax=Hyphomonas johnsonii MHS-2 TaxID=1280950 RepID=A0A059FVM5_9PROT|nr:arginine N-succinyltransferase [Hyphomonas johnsonii]KCZ94657.1 arginine/ornithine succinyltransferase subunit [Hyphomonas johnsonii MHS-2]